MTHDEDKINHIYLFYSNPYQVYILTITPFDKSKKNREEFRGKNGGIRKKI